MALPSTWTDPATLEKAANSTLPSADFNKILGDLKLLGGSTGTVETAAIADGAVTQSGFATGVTSSPTTTSTVYVDLPDMAVTLTTVGGDLLCWLTAALSENTAGAGIFLALSLDGAAEVGDIPTVMQSASNLVSQTVIWRFTGVAPGSHTVKGRWRVTSGTGSADQTFRYLLVVEVKR